MPTVFPHKFKEVPNPRTKAKSAKKCNFWEAAVLKNFDEKLKTHTPNFVNMYFNTFVQDSF